MNKNEYKYYVELAGGLGNQLFQYAFARAMQIRHGGNVIYLTKSYNTDSLRKCSISYLSIDPSWVNDNTIDYWQLHPKKSWIYHRLYTLEHELYRIFNVSTIDDNVTSIYKLKQLILYRIGVYSHSEHRYNKVSFLRRPYEKYILGLWHNPDYFKDIESALRKEFALKDASVLPQKYTDLIRGNESVCIHIRRGDYLDYSYYQVCDKNYYSSSIDYIRAKKPGTTFLIFSDDIEWAKNNIIGNDIHYVEEMHEDYIDFTLMRMCKHFVISNSTFSWWAAYLGSDPSKIVICPDRWYNDGRNKKQLNLDGWIEMPTTGLR